MEENEEGFVYDQQTELVDFHYRPMSLNRRHIHQHYSRNRKYFQLSQSPYIDQGLRKEFIQNIYKKNQEHKRQRSVVFNNYQKTQAACNDHHIKFSSSFESGNLDLAEKDPNNPNHYYLYIRPDTNTKTHFQWFYFKVTTRNLKQTLYFTIKNMLKPNMLYKEGLKPYFRKCKGLYQPLSSAYQQLHCEVTYKEDPQSEYYNLDFSFKFDEQGYDQVQFCSQPPYTFTKLNFFLKKLSCKKEILCKSIMGETIPYLIYSAKKQVKCIGVIIARQHPGESVASWVLQGFLEYLQARESSYLDDYMMWIIVPMMNVDGVILGNNRTGIIGHDYNRNWTFQQSKTRQQKMFPQLLEVCNLIKKYKRKYPGKMKIFLDFHGHSSQPNVFTYGPPLNETSQYFYTSRLFPQLLSKKCDLFNLDQCSYLIRPDKKKSARSIAHNLFGIPFVYTIQSTFGIFNNKQAKIEDFIRVGRSTGKALSEFVSTCILGCAKQGIDKIVEQIKIKHQNSTNVQQQQFDSGSEQSQYTSRRAEFQNKIQRLLNRNATIKQQEQLVHHNSISFHKNYQERTPRLKTQESPKNAKSEFLPKINPKKVYRNNRTTNMHRYSEDLQTVCNPSIQLAQDPQKMSLRELKQRFNLLKNSKMSKKILVLNAYGI